MYGLVNKAIEQMVCTEHGEEIWEAVKERASVDVEIFIGMEIYPDDVTYRLLGAMSEVMGQPVDVLLEQLGGFWPRFTAREGYNHLLDMAGSSLQEFLENLDVLHACLVESFPRIRPPTFSYEQVTPVTFNLHYHSQRQGLAPMVIGLIKALARRFDADVAVEHVQQRDAGSDHDVFQIHLLSRDGSVEPRQSEDANE